MDILVKYCGGCNPRYDRSKIIKKLTEDFCTLNITTNSNSNKTFDYVLVLSGCMSSCANHKELNGKYGKMVVTRLSDYEVLVNTLNKIINNEI